MTTELHQHAVEVDTRIAATYRELQVAKHHTDTAHVSVRHSANQRQNYSDRSWSGSYAEAVESCKRIAEAQAENYIGIAAQKSINDAAFAELTERIAAEVYSQAEKEYGGWSRFFLVTGGHIHSTRSCSTCYPTTSFGWLPELSGLTETDAVNVYGEVLCTICYPTAPSNYVGGISDGLTLVERAAKKAEKDAEKAARNTAKAAKTLNTEDIFRGVSETWKVTTVAGAKTELRAAAALIAGFGYDHQRANAPSVRESARIALSAKGLTEAELDTIETRAVKTAQRRGY